MNKKCTGCKKLLPVSEFNKSKAKKDGLQCRCRQCQKLRYQQTKDRVLELAKVYRNENRELIYERNKVYNLKNVESLKLKREEYRAKNRSNVLKSYATYKNKYPERIKCGSIFNKAIRKGTIKRPSTCSMCGKGGKIQGHHRDYSKPLEVVWVCVSCHMVIHRSKTIESNNKRDHIQQTFN